MVSFLFQGNFSGGILLGGNITQGEYYTGRVSTSSHHSKRDRHLVKNVTRAALVGPKGPSLFFPLQFPARLIFRSNGQLFAMLIKPEGNGPEVERWFKQGAGRVKRKYEISLNRSNISK